MIRPPVTGLYVHWPYCARICPYCDFNVAKARAVDEGAWARAFEEDLAHWRATFGPRRLVSLYFGGGTPSLMTASLIEAVIASADRHFGFAADPEITIEANPDDIDDGALDRWRAAGINRLSLGVQSFDDAQLRFLGRNHDGNKARSAVDAMLEKFERSTFDLIYALPGEGVEAWQARLDDALATGVRHLSLYQLTIEPGTAFDRAVARGDWKPTEEGLDAELFETTAAMTTGRGLPPYEVSNHAASGHEAVHNSLYWRGADWLAIGPGAHGRVTTKEGRWATVGARAIGSYLATTAADRLTFEGLDEGAVLTEALAGGLRPVAGLETTRLGQARGSILSAAAPLIADELLALDNGRLAATLKGRLVLDSVTAELLAAL